MVSDDWSAVAVFFLFAQLKKVNEQARINMATESLKLLFVFFLLLLHLFQTLLEATFLLWLRFV